MTARCPNRLSGFAVAALFAVVSPSVGAEYPAKPVKIITQAGVGSGPDVIGRIVAEQFGRRLGQQVLIVNHPGAGGLIAAQAAVLAEPDGYTLYMASGSALTVLPEMHPNLSFSFERDFEPIGMVGETGMVVAVSSKLGVSSLTDLIAFAKEHPGELFFAGNTPGTVPMLTCEMLKQRAGIDMTFVSYPGTASALKDIAGGRISVICESLAALRGAIQDGILKPLAVGTDKPVPELPNVPPVAETFPGFQATGWFALMAKAGTPQHVIEKVSRALNATLQDADVRAKFETLGTQAVPMSPQEISSFVASERKKWLPVIRHVVLNTR
jgi:tripartite-type tricarboxylate transporter receptor subunit TctC